MAMMILLRTSKNVARLCDVVHVAVHLVIRILVYCMRILGYWT